MFIIKKLLTPLSSPFFVACVLILVGLGLLWFAPRHQGLGKLFATAGALLILLFAYDPATDLALGALERRHPPLLDPATAAPRAKWIVVLGAGHSDDPRQPPTNQLNRSALARLVEGIRLLRHLPDAKLILSGAAVFDKTAHGEVLARAAEALGVPRARMVVESESRDTVDQARLVRGIVGDDPLVVVTSANHMPRSIGLFEKQGMRPVAAPTDVFVHPGNGLDPGDVFPAAHRVHKADTAFHEYAGMLFAKLRGQM